MGTAFIKTLALLSGAALAAGTFAGGEYLVWVGPKPLRFEKPVERVDPEKVLPPLNMTDSGPTNSAAELEVLGPELPVNFHPPEEFVGPAMEPPAEEQVPARAPTADALLQFFTPGTRRNAVITTPVEFAPPEGSSKSSTATYNTQ